MLLDPAAVTSLGVFHSSFQPVEMCIRDRYQCALLSQSKRAILYSSHRMYVLSLIHILSDFKAWLFLSLPQNASLSPWETLDFSGIFLRFGFTWKNGVKLGLKSRTFLVPNFARFIQSFLLQIIRLFCRQPCGEPAGWDYICLLYTSPLRSILLYWNYSRIHPKSQ